jgi:anti-sigma regulatory factor (Ser/Thr protein kinase)
MLAQSGGSGGSVTNMASHRSEHAARPVQAWTRVFPARPEQVRWARKFLTAAVGGCPVADDAALCLSELAGNSVLHSASSRPGGAFTVNVAIRHGDYVRIEVRDEGGPWDERPWTDGRAHGLAIVRALAAESGIDGDAATGWIGWARFDWPGADNLDGELTRPSGACVKASCQRGGR